MERISIEQSQEKTQLTERVPFGVSYLEQIQQPETTDFLRMMSSKAKTDGVDEFTWW
jgi:hypothetical protein